MRGSVVEFCCGYGGASAGILEAGLEIEKSYDNWQIAIDAHRAWHPNVSCELRDVATIEPEELRGKIVWAYMSPKVVTITEQLFKLEINNLEVAP